MGGFGPSPNITNSPGRAVFGITEDNTGAWWLATRAGLLRLAPNELARAFADTGYTLQYRVFDQLDGLPGAIGMTKLKVLTRSADGKIWVGADEGVASIDPHHLGESVFPLNVLVESVRIDDRELDASDVTTIPAGSSSLEIDYTATALSFPERVQFRYRLDGADPAWRQVETRRRAYYTDLRPGSYTFRVSANNGDGKWIDTGATWSFRVLPAWYQTFWFRALIALSIGSLGGLVVALVQRRRHARAQAELKRQYEITLAERVRVAEDLHDTLLQGFAGVNLQLIAAEIAIPTQPEVAAATLVRVQRLTEESLREARERVWEMRDAAMASDDLGDRARDDREGPHRGHADGSRGHDGGEHAAFASGAGRRGVPHRPRSHRERGTPRRRHPHRDSFWTSARRRSTSKCETMDAV